MSLEVHQKSDQDLENIRFYSLGWPTEKHSTLARLPTSRCIEKAPFTNTSNESAEKPCWMSLEVHQKSDQDLENIRFR